MPRADYVGQPEAEKAEKALGAIQDESSKSDTFDSAAAVSVLGDLTTRPADMPQSMVKLFKEIDNPEDQKMLIKVALDGVAEYERLHGEKPTGDLIDSAFHAAYSQTKGGAKAGGIERIVFDAATTEHHDQLSLQPNRAAIAILSAFGEAIPFANNLPADIGSNEARLIIVNHQSAVRFGEYARGDLMDGILSGGQFVGAGRRIRLTFSTPNWNGGFRAANTAGSDDTPDTGTAQVPLLRGRTIIYVDGIPVGGEASAPPASVANSPLTGQIVIGGTTYVLSGNVTPGTGVVQAVFTPVLPGTPEVHAEGFIDFEMNDALIPSVMTEATSYKLYAVPYKVTAQQTIDSRTQFANELGLDPRTEAMLAVRMQVANERHYDALRKMRTLARNYSETFDFAWSVMGAQKTRAQVWQDFSAPLGAASQSMAERTFDHGITHLYVGKQVASNMQGLPRDLFEPSGLADRPGIYFVGTLFGKYKVYYTPRGLASNPGAGTEDILAIGRSTQVARNPIVVGDAVAPTMVQIGVTRDMKDGFGFYARSFTSVNPHGPSALASHLFLATNLK